MELNKRIDAAARMGRSNRPKKRKKGDEDELDAAADAEVVKIKLAMELAALEDQESNKKGQPAVAKLKILQDVVDVLQKQSLMQSIIDHNLLENVRIWLEPLSDKSLPGLTIQRNLFEALGKMFIDANALKESGLGRIMLFYTKKNKRVTPAIKNQATNLVQTWSRPILKRSASYRDRTLVTADVDPASGKKPIKLSQILAQGRIEDAGRVRRNAVRIPQRAMPAFEIVPKSNVGTSGTNSQQTLIEAERRRAQEARLRQVQRKVALNKQRMSRM
ncbi:hypothetical protein DL93DRAFT_2071491 [Clavulina sp. PMI_390]|nr:hypothetical protein DL93DRAFT_2071491 [Clavulina sp. PMI_390]